MFFSLILVCLLWAGLHFYVVSRLLSIPFIAHHVPARLLIPVVILLGASYIVSRVLEHYSIDGFSHVLEIVGAYWVGAFFLLFSTFLALDLCTGFGLWQRPELPALRTVAFVVAVLMTIAALVQARRSPVVTEYEVALDGLPREADGTVLVVASDMHLGALLGRGWASERAAQFESLRPDILLLVGDIFEGDETTYPNWLPVLQQFRALRGVYVVTGNHEFYAGGGKIVDLFRRAGFHVLRDESIKPIPGLVLTGVDDIAFRGRAAHAAIMEKVLRERPEGASVLLSHTPVETQRAASAGIELMLSGHTHGGQIWPFNYLVKLAFPIMSGRYRVQEMAAIVCRGTGTWGPRMRLFKRSELLRITVRAKSERT
ncbi:MAG: metallophosphoesterase [Candidatus Korobacteraceae bacterium]